MRFFTHLFLLTMVLAFSAPARQNLTPVAAGARIYIEPMEWQMEQFITAEIRRQGLPVEIVANPYAADLVMKGSAEKVSSHLMSPGRCFRVTLVTANGSDPVWSGEGDDYATVFARLRSHGPARAARAIVASMRNRFFRNPR